ncbi:putative ABC transport system permease protein [Crenobacter luteus]|uniref:ABC transporter permease n=1 Tax=Crenobacter luteus TaxID=1452487 RepID=UPI0010496145|nr:FtsX-like permease family protein [Crenobacter luteus]TCP12660.1 putative ABC transport system permease protein [Crenobacter luteus]
MSAWHRLMWSLRMARRELVAGELTVLALALFVAVTAMTSVAFFSDRIERALTRQATQLLAADLVLNADAPWPEAFRAGAVARGLELAESASFPSMVMAGDAATLATLKAVSERYPLRGALTVQAGGAEKSAGAPAPGTAWLDARLMAKLGVKQGDAVEVGQRRLTVAGQIVREPDATLDLYSFVPRLLLNHADLASTGLVQEGSRIRWRLMVAGEAAAVADYRREASARLPRGARVENVEEARPEVRTALERARRFLGLTAMLTVALSAAAVALAVRRYLARHWQSVAVLRCLGLTSREVGALFTGLFALLALAAGALGTVAGFGAQALLLTLAAGWLGADALPAPGPLPWAMGPLSALLLLGGLALPPLSTVRRIPAVAVLRVELPARRVGWLTPLAAVFVLLTLTAYLVGETVAALWILAALAGFLAAVGLVALAAVLLLRRLPLAGRVGWRYGVANLARRPALAMIQVVALSVGLMALLTLTVVRADLIGAWRASVPADAPNKFVINIQPEQRDTVADLFALDGRRAPELAPMVRARLVAINGRPVRPAAYRDERARRLAEREFNLSWRDSLPEGNRVTAGRFWAGQGAKPQFSVEEGLAGTLGIRMGDTLSFDIAGSVYKARVTSLREVPWDSFRVNFFVLAPPDWFSRQPASYITSFRLPADEEAFASRMVERLPNLTVIDVGVILDEVRGVVERLAQAVEAMFVLALAAGVLVLWAALTATRDERLFDVALLRALGASRRQLKSVLLAELACLGGLAGLLAGLGAMALGSVAALQLFKLPFFANPWLPLLGLALGTVVVALAGWPLLRKVARTAPMTVLRRE